MNRKSIFIMLVIAFVLFWQTNHGTDPIPESFTPFDENVHNFFDSLKDTMDQAGYKPADFLAAARAALTAFKEGGTFNTFTVYTEQGFQQAYDFVQGVSPIPTERIDEIPSQEIFSGLTRFIQTCFASFSGTNPMQQLNVFLQLSGFYICIKQLYTGVTGICGRLYNFGKLTVSTFKRVYTFLTNNEPTNPNNNIPINISIPPVATQTIPQSASPTMREVKEKIDNVGGQIDENNTTLEEIMIIEGSMSAAQAQEFVETIPGVDIKNFNLLHRTGSLPTGTSGASMLGTQKERSVSVSEDYKYNGSMKTNKDKKGYHYNPYGGRSKSKGTKKRKQSNRRKTKRRKSTVKKYKRRRASSRKR